MTSSRLVVACLVLGAGTLVLWFSVRRPNEGRGVNNLDGSSAVQPPESRADLVAAAKSFSRDVAEPGLMDSQDGGGSMQAQASDLPPLGQPQDWSLSRLPSHSESLQDPDLNPLGRSLSLEEKKSLAAFVRERNVPIAMKVLQRDDLIHELLTAKIKAGVFEYGTPVVHEVFVRRVPQADGTTAFVALYPGENEKVDELHAEIRAAMELARAEIRAFLGS